MTLLKQAMSAAFQRAKDRPRITITDVRQVCRSYKSTREIAAELAVSTRTIERRLNELRDAGYNVLIKMAWDGQHKRSPHYRVTGRAK